MEPAKETCETPWHHPEAMTPSAEAIPLDSENHHKIIPAAQGGGGSFQNGKPIGEVGCCESWMAERPH